LRYRVLSGHFCENLCLNFSRKERKVREELSVSVRLYAILKWGVFVYLGDNLG